MFQLLYASASRTTTTTSGSADRQPATFEPDLLKPDHVSRKTRYQLGSETIRGDSTTTHRLNLGLEQATEQNTQPATDGEEIDHEQIPTRYRQVPLIELIKPSRRRKVPGNFEVIPHIRHVVALEDSESEDRHSNVLPGDLDWEYVPRSEVKDTIAQQSYADVVNN